MGDHFNDRVVWITGASSGIGEALAYTMSAHGAKLILTSRRVDELERVKNACHNPDEVKIFPLDLSDIPSLDGQAEKPLRFLAGLI